MIYQLSEVETELKRGFEPTLFIRKPSKKVTKIPDKLNIPVEFVGDTLTFTLTDKDKRRWEIFNKQDKNVYYLFCLEAFTQSNGHGYLLFNWIGPNGVVSDDDYEAVLEFGRYFDMRIVEI